MLMLARGSVLLFSISATVMACLRSNIYHLVGESSVLSLVTLFAALVLGLYWKGASSTGAILSMFSGFITWLFFEFFYETDVPSLVPGAIVSIVALVVGSLLWTNKHENRPAIERKQ